MANTERDFTMNTTASDLEDCDDSEALLGGKSLSNRLRKVKFTERLRTLNAKTYLLVIALMVILVESAMLVQIHQRNVNIFQTPNGLSYQRTVDRTLYEHSKYLSPNETEASLAWDAILAGHGVVAIDEDYIARKSLPASEPLTDGSGKFLYAIEAYHAMHCIKTIRTHYLALEQGRPWAWSRPHDLHCFDALRQYVMCNVDNTLLWTTGNRESGTGQSKKCNDWDALRDWAEERSANYFDNEPSMGMKHLDNYHEGDGLIW